MVVEINGDKITVNGKSLEDYKDQNGDISVRLNKLKDLEFLARIPGAGTNWNFNNSDGFKILLTMPTMRCLELLQNEQMGRKNKCCH